jgi:ABC-2 type transport system permease protein
MQDIAAVFPLKWLTQGMRSVFLPDSFAMKEAGRSWELGKTALILIIWLYMAPSDQYEPLKRSRE